MWNGAKKETGERNEASVATLSSFRTPIYFSSYMLHSGACSQNGAHVVGSSWFSCFRTALQEV